MGEETGEWLAALAIRLFRTCAMRRRSAITGGRSCGRSIRTVCRPPPERKVFRARSTSAVTSEGSGVTESVPASMRPASSRAPMRPRMCPACSRMMRWNSCISAGSRSADSSRSVAAEPMMEVSGARSSWLTKPRNSARSRSSSSQRRQVLKGHHDRADPATLGGDGRGVDQRAHAAPVRNRQLDLLAAHRLAGTELLRDGELAERHLAAVAAAKGHHVQQLLRRATRRAQAFSDASRLAVDRHRAAALAHRRPRHRPARSR